jgi:hypothetical protein
MARSFVPVNDKIGREEKEVMASTWIAYNELAWTEEWLADQAEYEDKVNAYIDRIERTATEPPKTFLNNNFAYTGEKDGAWVLGSSRVQPFFRPLPMPHASLSFSPTDQ